MRYCNVHADIHVPQYQLKFLWPAGPMGYSTNIWSLNNSFGTQAASINYCIYYGSQKCSWIWYIGGGSSNKNTLPLHGKHLFLIAVLVWSNISICYEAPSEQCNFLKRLHQSIFKRTPAEQHNFCFNDSSGGIQFF